VEERRWSSGRGRRGPRDSKGSRSMLVCLVARIAVKCKEEIKGFGDSMEASKNRDRITSFSVS
jgi:hypothetical protein